jgi:hypothetical protein
MTLTGSIFGMQWDALLIGFFGGLIALQHIGPMTKRTLAGTLFAACVLAGYFSPIVSAAIVEYMAWTSKLPLDVLRRAAALRPSASPAPTIVPMTLGLVARAPWLKEPK